MPIIYRAKLKNTFQLIEKLKYIIVNDGKINIVNNKKYNSDSSSILTFLIEKSSAEILKNHIKENIDFLKIDHPAKFLELLKDKFDIQEHQQEQSEFNQEKIRDQENNSEIIALNGKKEQIKQYVLESLSPSTTPILDRRNSVRYESIPESISLRKAPSLHDLPNENSPKISRQETPIDLNSSQNSIPSQDSEEQASLIVSAQKICLFFTEKSSSKQFENIKNHGEKIKNGSFNGEEKSKILLSITKLAEKIKNNNLGRQVTAKEIDKLKKDITDFKLCINDASNFEKLSRYRGFSPFKCFATLWGGGKVTSKEYVKQLQDEFSPLINEFDSLINEVLLARPTA